MLLSKQPLILCSAFSESFNIPLSPCRYRVTHRHTHRLLWMYTLILLSPTIVKLSREIWQIFCHKCLTLDLRLTETDNSSAVLVSFAQPWLNIKITNNILKCKQTFRGQGSVCMCFDGILPCCALLTFQTRRNCSCGVFQWALVISAEELFYERISTKVGCHCPLLSHP